MWSHACFGFYLTLIMYQNLEGTIYNNFYSDSCAGIIGTISANGIYTNLKMRKSYQISYVSTIFGTALIALL